MMSQLLLILKVILLWELNKIRAYENHFKSKLTCMYQIRIGNILGD